jgi:PAS domain-containing protein
MRGRPYTDADRERILHVLRTEVPFIALAAEKHFQETRELFQAEYRMFARDGRVLWFRDEAVMLHQAEGRPLLMQGVLYDMTEAPGETV